MDEILNHEEAVTVSKLTTRMLSKLVNVGRIPCAHIGEEKIYSRRLLVEAIEAMAKKQQEDRARMVNIKQETELDKPGNIEKGNKTKQSRRRPLII